MPPTTRFAADPKTDDNHPLSHHRLSTPLRPGIPPVGLLVHAFNCADAACALPNCFRTKGMVSSLVEHNARCPHARNNLDPKMPALDRNTCKPCRLFEALQRTRCRPDLLRRSTAAIQTSSVSLPTPLSAGGLGGASPLRPGLGGEGSLPLGGGASRRRRPALSSAACQAVPAWPSSWTS